MAGGRTLRSAGRLSAVLTLTDQRLHAFVQPLLAVTASRIYPAADLQTLTERLWDTPSDLLLIEAAGGADVRALCDQLRRFFQLPILIVEDGASEAERIAWLDGGADDVLTLRHALAELPARCAALARRVARQRRRDPDSFYLHALSMRLDVLGRRLFLPDGRLLDLNASQTRFLAALFAYEDTAVSRELMGQHMFGRPTPDMHRRLAHIIRHLKQRLETLPAPAPRIIYRRGAGYSLTVSNL